MSRIETIDDATVRIYALCDFPSWAPRYVGKTVQYIHERHKAHIRDAKRGGDRPVQRWLRKKIAANDGLAIKLLEFIPSSEDWADRERFWIEKFRSEGARMLNLTNGGEGLAGHKLPDSHKRKIAAALQTGETFRCLRCGQPFWRKRSAIAKGNAKFCCRACSNRRHK